MREEPVMTFVCSNNETCMTPYLKEKAEELQWRCAECGSLIVPLYYLHRNEEHIK